MEIIKVKGIGLIAFRNYLQTTFKNRYQEWLSKLPRESKKIYSDEITATGWYSVEDGLVKPMEVSAKLFHFGNVEKSAVAAGLFGGEYTLKGVYKAFLMIATPKALIGASKLILGRFYTVAQIKIDDSTKTSLTSSITKINKRTEYVDYYIIGWTVRALELANCKNVKYKILKPRYSDKYTTIYSWD